LVDYSTHLFEDLKLVDDEPHKVVPTWRNLRRGRGWNLKKVGSLLGGREGVDIMVVAGGIYLHV
jgi:hypothetical protein